MNERVAMRHALDAATRERLGMSPRDDAVDSFERTKKNKHKTRERDAKVERDAKLLRAPAKPAGAASR